MASSISWTPAAQRTTDIWTIQITAYHASTIYKIGVGKKYVQCIGAGGVNQTAQALVDAWNANQTERELMVADPSALTDTITLTGRNPGIPFIPVKSVSGGTGTIGAPINSVIATGPEYWNNGDNWSAGIAPINGDTVTIDNGQPILYGLTNTGVTLGKMIVKNNSQIGLPPINTTGGYYESLPQYLQIGVSLFDINCSSQLIRLDPGAPPYTGNVYATGTPLIPTMAALTLLGVNSGGNTLNAFGGSIGIAQNGGEVAKIAIVRMEAGPTGSPPDVFLGPGITGTVDATVAGGTLTSEVNLNSALVQGGTFINRGASTIGTLTSRQGGTYICMSSGTITQIFSGPDGTCDFTADIRGRTVTNCSLYKGTTFIDSLRTITFSNPYQMVQCGYRDVQLDLGTHIAGTVAAGA